MKTRWLALFFSLIYASSCFSLANPASVNCVKNGNRLILYKNTTGICIFKDGSYCEEWAYFRGNCRPGLNRLTKNRSFNKLNQYCLTKKGKQTLIIDCEPDSDPKTMSP